MYHSISDAAEKGLQYYMINTSLQAFDEQMKYLYENGYTVITLSDAAELLTTGTSITKKFAAITFDDGFKDFYTNAFPILKQYGFSATVFLPTGLIGDRMPGLRDKEHMNWDEIRALSKEGIKFGSHTVTHPQLTLLKTEDLLYELNHSKETIEENTGQTVESFSYPYAFPEANKTFKKHLIDIIEKCGYKNGVSTRIGIATYKENKYFLKRIPINTHDDNPFFRAKLEGGYDWLNKLQYVFKGLKGFNFTARSINHDA